MCKKGLATDEVLLDEIQEELHAIHEDLYFEASEPHEGVSEFIITAERKSELFPLVDAAIAAAPTLAGWKFTALKPPQGFEFVINLDGVELDPSGLWFLPLTGGANDQHLRSARWGSESESAQEGDNSSRHVDSPGNGTRGAPGSRVP